MRGNVDVKLLMMMMMKCKVMNFGSKNIKADYVMNDKVLNVANEEKDLGVIVCNNLKVSKQCVTASKKANQILGMIGRTFSCKSKGIVLKLYKALVRPHLDYCSQVWRPHLVKDKDCLEKVQRRATRMIEECRGLNYEERLKLTRLTTLETRRLRADMIEVYRILNSIDKVDGGKMFSRNWSDSLRGHSLKLFKKRFKIDIGKFCFSNRICSEWNLLNDLTVNAESLNVFKGFLDHHLRYNRGFK